MPHSATLMIQDTYVILTDVPLLSWDAGAPVQWSPSDLWPSPGQLEHVNKHLKARRSTFIVVGEPLTTGPGQRAPQGLYWLQEPLRQRALSFLRASAVQLHDVPMALRPPLLLDGIDPGQPHVRFARWSGMDRAAARSLGHVVRLLFPQDGEKAEVQLANLEHQLVSGSFLGAELAAHAREWPRPETD